MKKTKLFALFFILICFFVGCGEEESVENSANSLKNGPKTVDYSPVPAPKVQNRRIFKPIRDKDADVQRWPILATGQTKCYDYAKEIPCPARGERYYGQDGQTRMGLKKAYVVSDDETIRDPATSLIWTRHFKEHITWNEAKTYCDSISFGDGKKWRLPSTHELRSLINYGAINPAIDKIFYTTKGGATDDNIKRALNEWFWAKRHVKFNSEDGDDLPSSWIINFYDGFVEYTSGYNDKYNVRCVTDLN